MSGTLANPGDEATYIFTGTVGQTLYFDGLDSFYGTQAVLTDPNGNQVFSHYIADDSNTDNNYGPFTLSVTGTYSLTINNSAQTFGFYNFVLDDTATATPINLTAGSGTPETSQTLTYGLSDNVYQISGTAGERLYFQAGTQSPDLVDALSWSLYGPGDQPIYSGNSWDDFTATLPTAGNYLLVVAGTQGLRQSRTTPRGGHTTSRCTTILTRPSR